MVFHWLLLYFKIFWIHIFQKQIRLGIVCKSIGFWQIILMKCRTLIFLKIQRLHRNFHLLLSDILTLLYIYSFMENSIGLKRVNIYTSLPGKVNPFSNIEIHCMTIPDFQFSFFGSCCLKFTSRWGRHVLKKKPRIWLVKKYGHQGPAKLVLCICRRNIYLSFCHVFLYLE